MEPDLSESKTVIERIAAGDAAAPAIAAPGRPDLSYGALRAHMRATAGTLNGLGLGRNDRIAIILPNGPEMASAFVSVAACATTAPLNPAYRAEELDFYLSDIGAKAILVGEDEQGPAIDVAKKLGIAVLRLSFSDGDPAGTFTIDGPAVGPAVATGPAEHGDIALLLHTSGTTSRPKLVPLSHANLAASARNVAKVLALTPQDRCLNIMPLFHIHGLIAAVGASLSAGASVFCTPGFNALKFFAWLGEAKPSWYTAVPTMHQAILARAPRNAEAVAASHLRFVRSSSSSLPQPGHGRTGSHLPLPGHRGLRHDRGDPPDDLEPAAACRAQGGQRRPGGRTGGRHHGRGRQLPAPRASRARSSSADRTSPPATRRTRRPTTALLPMAGSTPATRASWTPTAMCASPGD